MLATIRPQTSKTRTYERGYLGKYQKKGTGISDLDSSLLSEHATPTLAPTIFMLKKCLTEMY